MALGGEDMVHGDAGNDDLMGGAGADMVHGGAGGDTIDGGTEDDVINGGVGDDDLSGGAGSNTFVFSPDDGAGSDIILDWEDGTNNRIDLSAYNLNEAQVIEAISLRGDQVIINLEAHGGGRITIDDLNFHGSKRSHGRFRRGNPFKLAPVLFCAASFLRSLSPQKQGAGTQSVIPVQAGI